MATTITGAEAVTWDLSDLYAGTDDPRITADLDGFWAGLEAFRERYRGRVAELDAPALAEAAAEGERLSSALSRLISYAHLMFTTDTADAVRGAFLQRIREQSARAEAEGLFFDLEWTAVDDDRAEELLADPALESYRHHLARVRRYRPHRLSEPEERVMSELGVVGGSAWSRFFTELNAATRIIVDGERVGLEQALSRLQRPEREMRRAAAHGLTEALSSTIQQRTFVFNTILLEKHTADRLRSYPTWLTSRNLANEASDESVDALVDAVVDRYDIPQRYYRLKAKLLGLDRLADYDRMAPLADTAEALPWPDAEALVRGAYEDFSPTAGRIIGDFFERSWIDAAPGANKAPGAYCATTIPGLHPYVFMTYTGERRSVLTLAHELGHALHGALAGERHGLYNASVPLTLAETASVFGEALTFRRLLEAEADPRRRLELVAGRLEDAIATVFRQVAMNRFEHTVHTARREQGELSTDDLNRFWTETQAPMLGDAVEITDGYRTWWSYVPHFVSVPGYVYAYAFGYLFSLAIFGRYQQDGSSMVEPYLELLRSGGSDSPERLAGLVGMDITDPGFWARGLASLDGLVSEAEDLASAL